MNRRYMVWKRMDFNGTFRLSVIPLQPHQTVL